MVWRLDGNVDLPRAESAILELGHLESTLSRDLLMEALENGMAFHNSDLSAEERSIVEKYFRQGEIRILVSTTTLAMGVNLPAKNVIVDLQLWQAAPGSHRYFLNLMSKSDFENIGGRAGRVGMEKEFGRAIVIATSLKEREVFKNKYLEGEIDHIKPQLWEGSMATAVMNSVALGDCESVEGIKKFLRNSLTWQLYAGMSKTGNDLEKDLETGIDFCFRAGILVKDAEGMIDLSALGKAAVNTGITVETALTINKWLNLRGDRTGFDDLELLFLASITDDGLDAYLNLSTDAYRKLSDKLITRFSNEIGSYLFQQLLELIRLRERNDYLLVKCMRNSYAFRDYIGDIPNRELEDRYNLCLGSVRNAAEQISWVISAVAEVAKKLGYSEEIVKRSNILAERLLFGVNSTGIVLARLRVSGLGRERIRTLVHQGFDTIEALEELSVSELARWVTKPVAERIKQAILRNKVMESGKSETGSISDTKVEDKLEVIGTMEKRRTLIRLNGQSIGLRDREFEVLLRLAMSRLEAEEGWVDKYNLGLPDAGITQGISRLREAISDYQLNPEKSLIENSNGHYRLALPPEHIFLNREKLREHLSATVHELVT
jgi:helicase